MYKTSKRQRKNKRKTLRKKAIHGGVNETCNRDECNKITNGKVKRFFEVVGEPTNAKDDKDAYNAPKKIQMAFTRLATNIQDNKKVNKDYFKDMEEENRLTIFSFVKNNGCCVELTPEQRTTINNAVGIPNTESTNMGNADDANTAEEGEGEGEEEGEGEGEVDNKEKTNTQLDNERTELDNAMEMQRTDAKPSKEINIDQNGNFPDTDPGNSIKNVSDLNSIIANRNILLGKLKIFIQKYKEVKIKLPNNLKNAVGVNYGGEEGAIAFADSIDNDPIYRYIEFYTPSSNGGRKTRKNKGGKGGKRGKSGKSGKSGKAGKNGKANGK